MGGRNPDKLFLLEFLVDKVTLREDNAQRFEENNYRSLLVTFKIEDFLCLDINQDAMKKEETHFGVTWHFCCGKSCTFAMQPQKLLTFLKDHPCYFIVGMLDNRDMSSEIMGACKANICCDLCDVIFKAEIKRDKYPLTSAIHQDTHNLRCPLGEDVGFVSVLVRLTCYGQAVLTRFTRMDGENKVYMYENKDPDPCAGRESNEEEEENVEFIDSNNALQILKNQEDRYKYVCQFSGDKRTDMNGQINNMHSPARQDTSLGISKSSDDQKATIVCTNLAELLPEITFQRRFPDDTVPVAPLLSKFEDENPDDCYQGCTCLREIQLNDICKTMFLCDRSSLLDEKKETPPDGRGDEVQPVKSKDTGVYHPSNPPVRYDTTSCLTEAYGGRRPVPLNALVEVEDKKKDSPNPPVRYDTTGALSPAFQGAPETDEQESVYSSSTSEEPSSTSEGTELLYPPAQNGASSVTCRCWCTCYTQMSEESAESGPFYPLNPPIRYDTTSALTAAAEGHRPVPLNSLVEVEDEKKGLPNPPVRYDTTGALSPAYVVQQYVQEAPTTKKHGKGFVITCDTDAAIPIPSVAFPNVMTVPWKKNWIYYYKIGEKHPGVKIGHSNCVPEFKQVPYEVGWLWKLYTFPGWEPGTVNTTVENLFNDLRAAAGMDEIRHRSKKQSKKKSKNNAPTGKSKEGVDAKKVISKVSPVKSQRDGSESHDKHSKKKGSKDTLSVVELPPTLHIHEQAGNYYIAMQPVNLYPENINIPLQFRIPIPKPKQDMGEESVASSELRVDYQAPAVYWPAKPKTNTIEIQCDSSVFSETDSPQIKVLMEPKQNNGGKSKKGKPGKKNNTGISQVVSWDKDPKTAVGKV